MASLALPRLFQQGSTPLSTRTTSQFHTLLTAALFTSLLHIPSLSSIWEGILLAVPKKKTPYARKRSRQMAGKALKDITSFNRCSGCGRVKRMHTLCPVCVKNIKDMWAGRELKESEELDR